MNGSFHDPDDTGYIIDEVKRLLADEPDPCKTDETVVFRPAPDLPTKPSAKLPEPKQPPEDAFELDIRFDDDEPQPEQTPPEKVGRSVKAYNSDYAGAGKAGKPAQQTPPRPVVQQPAPPQPRPQPQAPAERVYQVPGYQVRMQQTPPAVPQPRREPSEKRRNAMREEAERPEKKKKHPILKTLLVLILVLALVLAAGWIFFPKRPDATQMKKGDVSTVLIAGTDKDGTRTDTMLLLYLDKDAEEINLLSLPRDLLTYVDGNPMKLNAVYGYGGGGEAGMELLMDEMKDRIGFRPDGYMLFDFEAVEKLIDRMGGIKFDVPCDMDYEDPTQSLSIHLKEGKQRLSGEEALWVLRYRSGYALADLKRVEVQRDLVKAALDQWCSVWKLPRGAVALFGLRKGTVTSLSARELAWMAKTVSTVGFGKTEMATLPGEWNSPYYYPAAQDGADLLNRSFNPTTRTITAEDVGY